MFSFFIKFLYCFSYFIDFPPCPYVLSVFLVINTVIASLHSPAHTLSPSHIAQWQTACHLWVPDT